MRVLICPDKFRGTASAREAADALAAGAQDAGWDMTTLPLADGGEGTLDVLGGPTRSTIVTGPLGDPVNAPWRLAEGTTVIEMALASGLTLAGGTARNDVMAATTRGTGELVLAAIEAGATTVVIGVGGSATTDGGVGALDVLAAYAPLDGSRGYTVVVACDVTTRFVDAAVLFAPQKGATAEQVLALTRRLEVLADQYALAGKDIRELPHSGAAGGLAGGLAALGAVLTPGFGLVAASVGLRAAVASADHVITGEGRFDARSFDGKVVGGVLALTSELGSPCTVIAGDVSPEVAARGVATVSLTSRYGRESAMKGIVATLRAAARDVLS